MQRFGRETWSVVLPDDWHGQHDPECATLVADRAIGALQISAAQKSTEVTDDDLRGFAAEHIEAGARARSVQFGEFSGFGIAYGTEELFWNQWFLRNGKQALFVTYACPPEDRGVEEDAILYILSTLSASGAEAD